MKKLCLATLLMLVAAPDMVAAADWVALPGAGLADQYFYDRSKLTIKDDDITYWKKVIFKAPQDLRGKVVASGLLRERIDCTDHTAKLLSYLYYSPSGETVEYVAQDESEPAPVIPDTVGDAFERVLCPQVWHKQEEARIKAEQKAAAAELAASKREARKQEAKPEPKPELKADPKQELTVEIKPDLNDAEAPPAPALPQLKINPATGEIVVENPSATPPSKSPAKPATKPLPMPRVTDKLY